MSPLWPFKHYAVPQGGHLWRTYGGADVFPDCSFQNTVIHGVSKMLGELRGSLYPHQVMPDARIPEAVIQDFVQVCFGAQGWQQGALALAGIRAA